MGLSCWRCPRLRLFLVVCSRWGNGDVDNGSLIPASNLAWTYTCSNLRYCRYCFVGVHLSIFKWDVVNLAHEPVSIYLQAILHQVLIPVEIFEVVEVAKIFQRDNEWVRSLENFLFSEGQFAIYCFGDALISQIQLLLGFQLFGFLFSRYFQIDSVLLHLVNQIFASIQGQLFSHQDGIRCMRTFCVVLSLLQVTEEGVQQGSNKVMFGILDWPALPLFRFEPPLIQRPVMEHYIGIKKAHWLLSSCLDIILEFRVLLFHILLILLIFHCRLHMPHILVHQGLHLQRVEVLLVGEYVAAPRFDIFELVEFH